ncbi:MAG: hypothetical protein HY051_04715 [Candidatus Aenigmarchaeota archaeon]|nr:hypothetical protein [Candidatus Aenigmarchaeota archaeon]
MVEQSSVNYPNTVAKKPGDIGSTLMLANNRENTAVLRDRLAVKMAVYFNSDEIRKQQATGKEKLSMTDRLYVVDRELIELDWELERWM